MPTKLEEVLKTIDENSGIKLDLGCGNAKQDGWVGMDKRKLKGVDIVHNVEDIPWPLPSDCCITILCSHLLEHLDPRNFLIVMAEVHRVSKQGCQVQIATPYAGSPGAYQDPTHCYSPDTEVLTRSGFKRMCRVNIGEDLLTLSPGSLKTSYKPCVDKVDVSYEGKLLHFKSKRLDLLVTPNHQMLWSAGGRHEYPFHICAAQDFLSLKGKHSRRGYALVPWVGTSLDKVRIPRRITNGGKHMPVVFDPVDFCSFMGWWLSEGSLAVIPERGMYRVNISQSRTRNVSKLDEIREVVERLGFSPHVHDGGVTFCSRELSEYLLLLGSCASKHIPRKLKDLSPFLLRVMLDALVKGDGSPTGRGWQYATASRRLADDVQEIALKAGYRATSWTQQNPPVAFIQGRKIYPRPELYFVGICPPSAVYYPQPRVISYSGRVVCVSASVNHIILVRRNGRVAWCGNTRPGFNERTWAYFDPRPINGMRNGLYGIYKPPPFFIESVYWDVGGNMEVLLRVIKDKKIVRQAVKNLERKISVAGVGR